MLQNTLKTTFLLLPLTLLAIASSGVAEIPPGCSLGARIMFFDPGPDLDREMQPGFSADLFNRLRAPLAEIGYCFKNFDSTAIATDTTVRENLVMFFAIQHSDSSPESPPGNFSSASVLMVGLIEAGVWSHESREKSLSQPLLSFSWNSAELSSTLESVLVRKIVENLRIQYVCHARIQTYPSGVEIGSETGLTGISPLEWILPVGVLEISGEKEGFETMHRKLDLTQPGTHTFFLSMRERQFYRSGFIYPAIAFGAATAACYALDRYYYRQYLDLGREDYFSNPEQFGNVFETARNFEYAAVAALVMCATSFTLSFWF